jgi:hypothetical protein
MIPPNITPPNFPSPTPRPVASNSRYFGIDVAHGTLPDGRPVSWLRRRFISQPEVFTTIALHLVVQGDRLDNVTARYLGDPEQFWRLCDANGAMQPDELTATLGRRLRITLPEGVPGAPGARNA